VSTVVYDQLTTKLAMSSDGARDITEVDAASWTRLSKDAGFRPGFVTRTVDGLLAHAAREAAAWVQTPSHDNPTARRIGDQTASCSRPASDGRCSNETSRGRSAERKCVPWMRRDSRRFQFSMTSTTGQANAGPAPDAPVDALLPAHRRLACPARRRERRRVDEVAFLLGHRDETGTRTVYVSEVADARRRTMRRSRMAAEYAGALRAALDLPGDTDLA
jgi:hypothetical protein